MGTKIPNCQNDVTKDWLKGVLKSVNQNDKIEVSEIVTIKEKNGFLSGVSKAKVKINGQEKSLFMKIIVEPDDPLRFMYNDNQFDEVEIKFYKALLKNYNLTFKNSFKNF